MKCSALVNILILIFTVLTTHVLLISIKKIENCYTNNITLIIEKCDGVDLTVNFVVKILYPIHKIDVREYEIRVETCCIIQFCTRIQIYNSKQF